MENKNVVLVHGAWADGSSWAKVISLLQRKGFYVTAVQLPLTSLEDDIQVTRNALELQNGPTVLVGHSYGGMVISGAAANRTDVSALVYIAAFAPEQGESLETLGKGGPTPPGAAQVHPDGYGLLWIDRKAFAEVFAGDVDPVEANLLAAVQKPLSLAANAGKSGLPAWKQIPSWYMVSANDQMIPPQAEEFMARRMGATVRTITSSHAAMVSHPEDVTDLIVVASQA